MTRGARRVVTATMLAGAGGIITAAPSSAEEEDATGIQQIWEGLTDTRGNPVDDFTTLSFYDGGWTGAEQKIFGPAVEFVWGGYATFVRTQIIILDWIMSLGWKDFVLGPLQAISNVMATIMSTLGLRPFMLLILAIGVALLLFRRKSGTAVSELFVGSAIAALAIGLLANPMAVIAGQNGAITQAQSVGMTLSTAITTGGESMTTGDDQEMRNALTSQLIDSLLRTPHQVINYGQVIDGTTCEEAYDQALGDEDGRLVVGACDGDLQKAADHPNAITLVNTVRLYPAMLAFSALSTVIALVSLGCVLACGWFGVKLAWDLIMGIAPGSSRTGLFRTLGGLAASLGVLALSVPLVVLYMQIVSGVTGAAGGPIAALFRFDLITLFLLLGCIVFVIFWVQLRRSGKNLASALSKLGKQQNAPSPHQVSPATRAREGLRDVTQIARQTQGFKQHRATNAQTPSATPDKIDQGVPERQPPQQTPTRSTSSRTHTQEPETAPTTAPERLQQRLKTGAATTAKIGVHAGIAATTGGTSLAAAGGKAATTAASSARVARAAQAARKTHARARQVKVAMTEGRERPVRTNQNQELRRRLKQPSADERSAPDRQPVGPLPATTPSKQPTQRRNQRTTQEKPADPTPSPTTPRPRSAPATQTGSPDSSASERLRERLHAARQQ